MVDVNSSDILASKPHRRVKRIVTWLVILASISVLAMGALYAFVYFAYCSHCYAFASTPEVARAVVKYYAKYQRPPSNYAELRRAVDAGEIKSEMPWPLYKGEWSILSIDSPPRFAAIYRRTDGSGVPTDQILGLLRDPSTTQTQRIRGPMLDAYEVSPSGTEARELFFWDGTGWSPHYGKTTITVGLKGG